MTTRPPPPFVVARAETPAVAALKGAVVAVGNFDGVHLGHRAVIDTALARARALGKPAAALTFDPHPRSFFRPDEPLFLLTDHTAKLRLLACTGLDGAIVLKFDAELVAATADEFIRLILVEHLGIAGAAVGFDFRFGKNRTGTLDMLAAEGRQYGFAVDVVPALALEGQRVSSGVIRAALAEGRVEVANELLGYPWFVTGEVVHGDKRGRTLGFPTANLRLDPACGLRHGIYAVRMAVDGVRYDGVASFGRRPMFDVGTVLLEVFLFDFAGDLYGKTADVAFIGWIRPELKFDSVDDLVRRMEEDSHLARAALARAGNAFPALAPLPI